MKTKIIFATSNANKMHEIREIMEDINVQILSMKEAGIDVDIHETGDSFIENALIKAKAVSKLADAYVFADDSGLEIDYLNKEPGIYSSRYLGEDTSYSVKNTSLIKRLDGVPENLRTARFVCAIAVISPFGKVYTTQASIEGIIQYNEMGKNGFGYDPIFYLPEYKCTTAQLTDEEKNKISHRGKALRMMRDKLISEAYGDFYSGENI